MFVDFIVEVTPVTSVTTVLPLWLMLTLQLLKQKWPDVEVETTKSKSTKSCL